MSPRPRRFAPARRVQRVDGELLSWYGSAPSPGWLSADAGATTIGFPSAPERAARPCRRWKSSSRCIALLAIVNPIGVIPFFIHFTAGFSREQRRRDDPRRGDRRLLRHRRQRPGRAAHHRVLRHLAGLVPGRRRHAAAGVVRCRCSTPSRPRAAAARHERRQRQGRRRRLDRDRAADHPAAHRPGDDLHHGHLCREDAPLVGARDPGRLRRRHRPGGLDRVQPSPADRAGARPHRHQRHDAG